MRLLYLVTMENMVKQVLLTRLPFAGWDYIQWITTYANLGFGMLTM